jgi:hypothetical protein
MRAMRRVCVVAAAASLAWLGCRFEAPAGEAPGDGTDAGSAIDGPPGVHGEAPACLMDASYTANTATGRRYKLYPATTLLDYDSAIDLCAADGAQLAVIETQSENDYLKAVLPGGGSAWIGFDDLTVEGTFKWITGVTGSYPGFGSGEPNDGTGNGEDCAFLKNDGKWDDNDCSNTKRVLCECDPAHAPPPTPMCRGMAGAVTRKGRKYFARTTPKNWPEAQADCRSIDAHLAVIGDLKEDTDLDGAFTGASWIGFSDTATEGQFVAVNGAPTPYTRFTTGVPINDIEDCVALQDGGLWEDLACDAVLLPYICECDPLPP